MTFYFNLSLFPFLSLSLCPFLYLLSLTFFSKSHSVFPMFKSTRFLSHTNARTGYYLFVTLIGTIGKLVSNSLCLSQTLSLSLTHTPMLSHANPHAYMLGHERTHLNFICPSDNITFRIGLEALKSRRGNHESEKNTYL